MILAAIVAVLAGACLCMLRAILGPTAPDRVVAIDALTSLMTACLVLLAVLWRAPIYLDVALVYAFLAFIGTLAVSKYLEGRRLES
ncbi:MAG: monovalent cation/H+ antiporter complex subunit F [Hadesarchaea archaeon]|nr:monovalent cation/H+ antiporter complex subunit F [Hadesarchaea archaeon]